MLEVILGSFSAFPFFNKLASQKQLVVERNGVKFGPWGWAFTVCRTLLTVKWLRAFWGHSVHFRFLTTLYLENDTSYEQNVHQNVHAKCKSVIQFYVVIVWHLVKQSIKGPGLLVISWWYLHKMVWLGKSIGCHGNRCDTCLSVWTYFILHWRSILFIEFLNFNEFYKKFIHLVISQLL